MTGVVSTLSAKENASDVNDAAAPDLNNRIPSEAAFESSDNPSSVGRISNDLKMKADVNSPSQLA